jgi:hypothetical protein
MLLFSQTLISSYKCNCPFRKIKKLLMLDTFIEVFYKKKCCTCTEIVLLLRIDENLIIITTAILRWNMEELCAFMHVFYLDFVYRFKRTVCSYSYKNIEDQDLFLNIWEWCLFQIVQEKLLQSYGFVSDIKFKPSSRLEHFLMTGEVQRNFMSDVSWQNRSRSTY